MTETAQLKKAQHIISLQIDDLEDLTNDMPLDPVLDKNLQELVEKSARVLFLIKQKMAKPVKTEQTENTLNQHDFNRVFS